MAASEIRAPVIVHPDPNQSALQGRQCVTVIFGLQNFSSTKHRRCPLRYGQGEFPLRNALPDAFDTAREGTPVEVGV